MSYRQWRTIELPDVRLELLDRASGDPLLLIPTALTADEFEPVADRLARSGRYRVLTHRRRGYSALSPQTGVPSVGRDALDCRRLLEAVGVRRCHVAGLSYSAAVALELARAAPGLVASLTLLEPPPLFVSSTPEFLEANERLIADFASAGGATALDGFLRRLMGDDWREAYERLLPGSVAQMERDAAAFFTADAHALLAWRFGDDEARHIRCPVLHIGGTRSGTWFAEVRSQLLAWFPSARDVRVEGADHSLALTHPDDIATAMDAFLRDQPLSGSAR
ncbi:alpha/beta fold hydrolase [Naasia sp. SYSU D00057]|uniref:alpha/beta fold hydrolase n=1 Tax=Naasia sp. SYSU D00057 TaxID=2817380 RepID=UPI001B305EE0|nr:alpha/beta hydrolase [Naasia sp. SYSU D00057]